MRTLDITQPDDWHLHLRDDQALARTVPDAAAQFGRAIIMPNLQPPVTRCQSALAYRDRILAARPQGSEFQPLMALYLTQETNAAQIYEAAETPDIIGYKLYPAGATTHSAQGVHDIDALYPTFEAMQNHDVPLLVHGEVVDADTDIFDREAIFIDTTLTPLHREFPKLRIVLEHITTQTGVAFVRDAPSNVAGTITAHHLLLNRNALLAGGLRPHHYCLPVLKRERDREALIAAAISGNPSFFLGSDSAPHSIAKKECALGCAGIYTGLNTLSFYAEAFDEAGALDKLEGFASHAGADFYKRPRNSRRIQLREVDSEIPNTLPFGDTSLHPFRAGETTRWQCAIS